jgi:valyl-tRNA synthetase
MAEQVEDIEKKWQEFWEKEHIYKTKDPESKDIFSIDTPPPTVSGKMHIGHAFSYSQADFIARFKRMKEGNVFYPFGTDDNGLPTERLVEKINNVRSVGMSRAEFIKLCLKTLKDISPEFIKGWKRLGISCDFEKTYSTIDHSSQKTSQKSFIDLYKKDHIYKKNLPTIWCPECQTSIAQAELEDKEMPSKFSTLKFKVDGKNFPISTTRPELLYACVAVFVNQKDKRYKSFVGKKAKVPIFDFEVPIVEDDSAQIDKGTGALMICSYGDRFDVDAINRHSLKPRAIITKDGKIEAPGYEGLKIKDARKKILGDLKDKMLIEEQKEINHVVNVHDKCGTEIEFVETPQWFIKVLDKKKEFLKQAEKISWHPKFMKKRYDNWVKGLEWDWSISRNRHFGVPIPVWECPECKKIILPEEAELPVDPLETKRKCPKCGRFAEPEKMVLDTWATSSATPNIASSMFGNKVKIPFSLRPQAHDIIRTWAFYTIVKAYLHEGKIPWKEIIISGNVSLGGEKMSKSKGNVIDPREVIEKYGADALRFWAAGSSLGQDLDYQEKDLITGKKLVNKITNASKFVFMNLKDYDGKKKPKRLERIDELFLAKLDLLVREVTKEFGKYNYSGARNHIEKFFWDAFTGNYLEIVKKRVYQGERDKKLSAQYTLYKALLTILKLIAPIMPFITEEIYQENFRRYEKEKSIHLERWPKPEPKAKASEELDSFFYQLSRIRQEKTNNKKSMNSEIMLTLEKEIHEGLKEMLEDLKNVTNSRGIKPGEEFRVEFF